MGLSDFESGKRNAASFDRSMMSIVRTMDEDGRENLSRRDTTIIVHMYTTYVKPGLFVLDRVIGIEVTDRGGGDGVRKVWAECPLPHVNVTAMSGPGWRDGRDGYPLAGVDGRFRIARLTSWKCSQ